MLREILISVVLLNTISSLRADSFREDLFKQKGTLLNALIDSITVNDTTIVANVLLINDRNDTIHGRIRYPNTTGKRFPLAILVVGIETGREVVEMIKGYNNVIVFGINYPFRGQFDFSDWKALPTTFALRKAAFKTVAHLLLSLDWLSSQPFVDTTDITMVAVSFGVFTAAPTAAIDSRIDRLVVVQAGGNIAEVIGANADRLGIFLPSWLAGWIAAHILHPFEPNDFIGDVAPRPLLLISGEADTFFPESSVKSFYEHARQPKEWVKHRSGHVYPGEVELVTELTNIVAERLYGGK
ncbi:MAG: hypothetical protein HY707_11475 [Ignavibacteriae bacterium]|nr:hypothetical protein [Ignavibacteriota bacterium]